MAAAVAAGAVAGAVAGRIRTPGARARSRPEAVKTNGRTKGDRVDREAGLAKTRHARRRMRGHRRPVQQETMTRMARPAAAARKVSEKCMVIICFGDTRGTFKALCY